MAVAVANLRERYGRDLRERLRANLIMAQLCNSNYTGDVRNAAKVQIISPADDLSSSTKVDAVTANVDRNPTYAAPVELETESRTLEMDRASQLTVSLGIDDMREATFNMIEAANSKIARRLAFEIDSDVTAFMIAGVPGTNRGTTQKPSILGDATDYIAADGSNSTDAAAEFVIDAFISAGGWAMSSNVWRTGLIDHQLWAVMDAPLWVSVQNYIRKKGNSELLSNLFGGGPRSQLGVTNNNAGTMNSVNVFINTLMPKVAVSNKDHWQILFGTRQYTTLAARPVHYSISREGEYQPGAAIGYTVNGYQRYGRLVVNPEQVRIATIRAEA